MAVKEVGEVYKCNICGNVVRVVKAGGGTLVCCGRDMERIKEEPAKTVNLPDSGA